MGLLEREAELSLVESLIAELADRRGNVIVVSGPPGAGRTALLSAFAEMACVVGIPVVTGGYSPFETGVDVDLLERVVDRPALVCVDDAHKADVDSMARLMRLASAARSMPIVLVLGMRAGVRQAELEAAAYLHDRVRAHRIELSALSLSSVCRFASDHGLDVDERTAARMSEVAGGNLALLKAVFADLAVAGPDAAPERLARMVGPAYCRSVLECLHRLSPPVREVARAIAVLREFAALRTVAEVVELPMPVVDEAVSEMRAAGLLTDGRLYHHSVETAVLDALTIQESAALHQRAAVAMRKVGVPAVEVARRLIAADQADASWTGYLVDEVVAQALARDDRALATDALRLALRGAVGDEARADILVRFAVGYEATDPDLCCQYFHEAGALVTEAQLWLQNSSVLSGQMIRRGRGREAMSMLAAAEADADADDRLRIAADRLLVCGDYPGLLDAVGTPPLVTVPEDAGGQGARYAAARFLVSVLSTPELAADAVRAAEDAFYGCTFAEHTAASSLAALTGLLYAGELELVQSLATELVSSARRRRTPVWQARFLALRAEAMIRAGHYQEGAADAEQALSLLPPPAWGVWIGGPVSSLVLAATMAGEQALAHRHLAGTVPASMFETRYGAHYLYGRGHLHLLEGRVHAAFADFAGCGRLLAGWNIDHERVLPWRLAAAGALLALGGQDESVDLIDERIRRVSHRAPVPGARGMTPVVERRTPRERVFDVLAGEAYDGRLVEAIRAVLAADGAPVRGGTARYRIEDRYSPYLDKLTVSEQQVAILAAMGRSNRDIARSLSVTISTVEQHLTRTYRKLQFAGRQELRARLG